MKNPWIYASKQLPNETMEVIAFVKQTSEYSDTPRFFITDLIWVKSDEEDNLGSWCYNYNDYLPNSWTVLFWMPMPEIPEVI